MKATVISAVLDARDRAKPRNDEGMCGASPCGGTLPGNTCSLCRRDYCVVHLNNRTFRVLETPAGESTDRSPRYRKERHYLCDDCAAAMDRFRLITLPPIPYDKQSAQAGLLSSEKPPEPEPATGPSPGEASKREPASASTE